MELIKELKFKYKSFLTTNQVRNAKAIWQKQKLKKDHLPRLINIIKDNFEEGEKLPSNVYVEVIKNSRADVDGFCGKYLWDAMTAAELWEDDNPKYWGKYSVEDNKGLGTNCYIVRVWDFTENHNTGFVLKEDFKEY